MTEPGQSRLWVAVGAALIVFAGATWFSWNDARDASGQSASESSVKAPSSGSPMVHEAPESTLRITEHGHLSVAVDALPTSGLLSVVLELPDVARGEDLRVARIVSTDGRRIDTTASPLAGSGSGVQIDIDPDFLSPGRYMIEIKTRETTPLPLRRYVLEIE